MQDYGISLMRILHFFPQLNPAGERYTLSQGNPEWVLSKLDALLQLCQQHGIAMILSLHDWIDRGAKPPPPRRPAWLRPGPFSPLAPTTNQPQPEE